MFGGMSMAKRSKNNCVLGLDLGTYAVKAVEMMRSGDELYVSGYAYELVRDPAKYGETIKAVIRAGDLRAECIAIGMSGTGTLVQTVTTPVEGEGDLKRALIKEAEEITRRDLADSLVDYHLFQNGEASSISAIVAAASREELQARMEALGDAGLYPDIVDTELTALVNAYETANAAGHFQDERQGVILADFGAAKTLLAASANGAYLFREFLFGGINLTELVADRMSISLDQAERIKCEPGEHIETVRDAVYPGIEELASEIRSLADCLKTVAGAPAKLLLLSGGLVLFPGLVKVLGKLAKMETRAFDSFGSVMANKYDQEFLDAYIHEFPLAFGLACHARD